MLDAHVIASVQGELIKECFSIDVFTLKDPCVSFVQPLLQPASSDPGVMITACVRFDVPVSALSLGGDSVRPGVPLFMSCQSGDWDRLLLPMCIR